MYTIVETCKMNAINPQAYLTEIIGTEDRRTAAQTLEMPFGGSSGIADWPTTTQSNLGRCALKRPSKRFGILVCKSPDSSSVSQTMTCWDQKPGV
jgi:hypothetical protein